MTQNTTIPGSTSENGMTDDESTQTLASEQDEVVADVIDGDATDVDASDASDASDADATGSDMTDSVDDDTGAASRNDHTPAIEPHKLKQIIEGALLAAGKPLTIDRLQALFPEHACPTAEAFETALAAIADDCAERGFELKKVASGYRFQVRQELSEWIGRLWEEKPQRYSRALMETLSIIAYRQPITRGDIEKIRGVAVSTQIVQTLLEHEWVRVVGHRDVPGRPAMYATTRQFLDYFNLESLDQLPPLSEIRDLEEINRGLSLDEDKPAGRIIEFPDPEPNEEDAMADDEEVAAAAVGTRPISEILSAVDAQLGQRAQRRAAGEEDEPEHAYDADEPGDAQWEETDVADVTPEDITPEDITPENITPDDVTEQHVVPDADESDDEAAADDTPEDSDRSGSS